MRRKRTKRDQPSVSLFPFLAVLICTLGVLIIMLVLAVKSADVQAKQKRDQRQRVAAEKVSEAEYRVQLEQHRADAILKLRNSVVDRLSESRKNRAYLQEDVRQAETELQQSIELLNRVNDQLKNISESTPIQPESEQRLAKQRINELKERIDRANEELIAVTKKKNESTGDSLYSLLPYRGSGGTFRRPIYVECDADGIQIQPLDVTIRKQDLALPLQPGNPLDAALLSIQEYWRTNDVAGKQGSPYPLLVVRPGGAETFVVARRAMKSWAEEFGYELVDDDKELNFGPKDTVLANRIQELVNRIKVEQLQATLQQRQLQAHLAQFDQGIPRGGLSASSQSGGFVSAGPANGVAQSSFLASAGGRGQNATGRNQFQDHPNRNPDFSSNLGNRYQTGGKTNQGKQSSNRNGQTANNISGLAGGQNSTGEQQGNSKFSSSSASSLANRRGAGWALPSQTSGGTGYLRPITLHCGKDQIRLRNASGQWQTLTFDTTTESIVDEMVEVIWNRIDSWGIAGRGSYWKPELRVITEPGGEQRLADLRNLLRNSGLVIENGAQ